MVIGPHGMGCRCKKPIDKVEALIWLIRDAIPHGSRRSDAATALLVEIMVQLNGARADVIHHMINELRTTADGLERETR